MKPRAESFSGAKVGKFCLNGKQLLLGSESKKQFTLQQTGSFVFVSVGKQGLIYLHLIPKLAYEKNNRHYFDSAAMQ
jgi:hypothetical protein